MQTEFTSGIFTALWPDHTTKWSIRINETQIALVEHDGSTISFMESPPLFEQDMLIELFVLMNNIKRQYKQSQIK